MSDIKRNKSQKKSAAYLSDDRVRDSLNAQGFYDSWITPELIAEHRKIMQAKMRQPYAGKSRHLIPGEFD